MEHIEQIYVNTRNITNTFKSFIGAFPDFEKTSTKCLRTCSTCLKYQPQVEIVFVLTALGENDFNVFNIKITQKNVLVAIVSLPVVALT